MPQEKQSVTCESCGKAFKLTGYGPHRKSCIKQARREREDNVYLGILRQASSSGSQQPSDNDDHGLAARLNAGPGLQEDVNQFWAMPAEVDPPADADNGTDSVDVDANNIDDILVEHHPSTARPSEKIPFVEFAQGHQPRAYKPDLSTDPWYPFRSRLDFEFAELALEAALSKEQINRFLKLIKSARCGRDSFTLNEYADLRSTWRATSHRMTAFEKELVHVDGIDGEPREFPVYRRSLLDWAFDLLKHPTMGPQFVFDAKCLFKFDGSTFVRFIDEPWTADEFWNLQSKLPPDGKLLPFILYADKAKLSSFSRQKGYPIVARLANLPTWIRNGEGIGGGRVVGWLPIVKEDKEYSGKPRFANFKNAVWHESFKRILGTIEKESETGCWVKCWDGLACRFFPVVLILSADYEEQAVMALVRGVKSNFPCPVCLIPRDDISKFPAQCELRTSAGVIKVLQEARSQETTEKREQILMQQGLRDVDNAFFVVANTDVYRALSWDRLHANFAGKFGDHLWPELLRILDKGGRQVAARVEKNFSMMPRWHGLNHFDDALSISYTDGQKFEDLSKLVVFACHDVLSPVEKEGYLLLRCLRAYIEFDLYTALELHTAHTLAAGREALATFNVLMQRFSEKTKNIKKNWNFPKNHTRMHVFDDIEAKGVTWNFSTKPNEKMHGPLKEKYQRRTNFKNVAEQILQVDHLELVSELIRCTITDYDTYTSAMEKNTGSPDDDDADEVEQEDFFHVRLGSRVKHPLTLEAVEQRSITNKAFIRFQTKLNEFLNRYFTAVGKTLPGGKHIQFQPNDQIMEFKYIKVNFESVVDWCQYMDHLRCNPSFHGRSHYDCILLKTQQQDIFGRLIFMFQCAVSEESFPLALVQPYDAPTQPRLAKDVHLNLWRVHEQPLESAEIFSVHSIIRGALLYPDHTQIGDYLVIDTLDTDIFLRVQKMHKAAGHH
ncbi:hypothetical protein EDD15DRAFT_2372818 [Pisolithus albus]|nr:hypothetical protein EDD15DRAFT_2372818 [Pisolithus albus]